MIYVLEIIHSFNVNSICFCFLLRGGEKAAVKVLVRKAWERIRVGAFCHALLRIHAQVRHAAAHQSHAPRSHTHAQAQRALRLFPDQPGDIFSLLPRDVGEASSCGGEAQVCRHVQIIHASSRSSLRCTCCWTSAVFKPGGVVFDLVSVLIKPDRKLFFFFVLFCLVIIFF